MGWVDPFWVGAMRSEAAVDWDRLAERTGGWSRLAEARAADLRAVGVEASRVERWLAAEAVWSRGEAVSLAQARYPSWVRELPGAPPVLLVEGAIGCLGRPGVAIVGTRSCTTTGGGLARRLAGALAAAGTVVISGLARGIDAHAHRGCLPVGPTVAVLGHGLGHTSPVSHRSLRERIVSTGGALVSTWLDDVPPARHTFPKRNRWVAALSRAVVVVEAPRRSGALITARLADELSLPVFAVPGRLGDVASAGCNRLLAQGLATAVWDLPELIEALAGIRMQQLEAWREALFAGRPLDDVARMRGGSVVDLVRELALMELRGEVVRLPGQRYAPAGTGS